MMALGSTLAGIWSDVGRKGGPETFKMPPKSRLKVFQSVICSRICETLFFDDPTVVWPSFTTSRGSENQSKTDKNPGSETHTEKNVEQVRKKQQKRIPRGRPSES